MNITYSQEEIKNILKKHVNDKYETLAAQEDAIYFVVDTESEENILYQDITAVVEVVE